MKFENIRVMNFENALRGMRNPKESWNLSDSYFGFELVDNVSERVNGQDYQILHRDGDIVEFASIGPNDMKLAQQLIKAGSEHRKFMRQIFVSVDITAPLFWYKEFDTYKVGTVANSTSTMHKLMSKPITIDCFEIDDFNNIEYPEEFQRKGLKYPIDPDVIQMVLIPYLEHLRQEWLKLQEVIKSSTSAKDLEKQAKKIWKELVRWLPEAWLQKRTITMNYENLLGMCSKGQRRFHKLNEWSGADEPELDNFIAFARELPYAQEFIFIDEVK
jgi:hypothetical protein